MASEGRQDPPKMEPNLESEMTIYRSQVEADIGTVVRGQNEKSKNLGGREPRAKHPVAEFMPPLVGNIQRNQITREVLVGGRTYQVADDARTAPIR